MFKWLSDKAVSWARPADDAATALYQAVASATRNPVFYQKYGVEDSLDGRFDALVLYAVLVVRRLKSAPNGKALAQGVIDTMFADLDLSLHEIGVSENKVGRRVKVMARAFLGRMQAYDESIESQDCGQLAAALGRNLYRGGGVADSVADTLATSVMAVNQALDAIDDDAINAETVTVALAKMVE